MWNAGTCSNSTHDTGLTSVDMVVFLERTNHNVSFPPVNQSNARAPYLNLSTLKSTLESVSVNLRFFKTEKSFVYDTSLNHYDCSRSC